MLEIRVHGRGGMGVVTTSKLIAIAGFYDKKFTQAFPSFGPERSGAPVTSFARIDDKEIRNRSQIYEPDVVIVLDSTLIGVIDVTSGLKSNGMVIVNTKKDAKKLGLKGNYQVYAVDAGTIAKKIFGREIVNTPILGAFSKISKALSLKSCEKAAAELFEGKGRDIVKQNKKAIAEVYKRTI